jgi:hypothetical protein
MDNMKDKFEDIVDENTEKIKEEIKPYGDKITSWLKKNGKKMALGALVLFAAIMFGICVAYLKL